MMHHIHKFTILLFTLFCATLTAQQDPYFTFYRYNMNLVNPAYAGSADQAELGLNFRNQWANIEGAPETQSLFFGMPVGKNVGLGVSIVHDRTFIEKQTALALDFSYKVQLNESNTLYFGLKAGFDSYNVNTAGLITYDIQSDPSLTNLEGSFRPNIGVGAYLKGDRYYISLSAPKTIQYNRLQNNDGIARMNKEKVHVYLSGGYDIPVSPTIVFKPSVMGRYVAAAPFSLDLTTMFDFSDQVEVGAAYRINESLSGIFLLKAITWMDIGYAYETALESEVRNIDNGTHEILARFRF